MTIKFWIISTYDISQTIGHLLGKQLFIIFTNVINNYHGNVFIDDYNTVEGTSELVFYYIKTPLEISRVFLCLHKINFSVFILKICKKT
jgi:hypothetical protein